MHQKDILIELMLAAIDYEENCTELHEMLRTLRNTS